MMETTETDDGETDAIVDEYIVGNNPTEFQRMILRRAVEEGLHEAAIAADGGGTLFVTFLEGDSKRAGMENNGMAILYPDGDDDEVGRGEMRRVLAFVATRTWENNPRFVFYYKGEEEPKSYDPICQEDVGVVEAHTACPYETFAAHPDAVHKELVMY